MEIILRVQPEELEQRAGALREKAEKAAGLFDEAGTAWEECRPFWEGEAADRHEKELAAITAKAKTQAKALCSWTDTLLSMAGIYRTTEEEAQETTASLLQDIILD